MIRYHNDLVQGTDEWLAERCGMLTASEMHLIITPTLKVANNDKQRTHLYELLAQRITSHVEPRYVSDDMLRGMDDEIKAIELYREHYADVSHVGFVTNDKWGFPIGYSPDGLVGEHGSIETKSRRQKYQVQTFVENVTHGTIPAEFMLQIQTGLMVTERKWCDFVSFSGGLPMAVVRVFPDKEMQSAITSAACGFELAMGSAMSAYHAAVLSSDAVPTKREAQEIML